MGLKKIIKKLKEQFELAQNDQPISCEEIDRLLRKLKHKEKKIKDEIEEIKDAEELSKIELDLKVVKLQLKKGFKLRKELKHSEKCTQ